MIKTKTWILLIAALLAVSLALAAVFLLHHTGSTVANIYRDGVCIRSVDLSNVKEGYEFTLEDDSGSNTIRVEPGRIRVTEADCPDGVCVSAGWISDTSQPIVCLPHKLVIRIEKTAQAAQDETFDAVSK